eukprot:1154011-Pelagomonas_calceolata.AAC.3
MRQQLGITGLPQTVTSVRLMMMSRMNHMSFSTAHIPRPYPCKPKPRNRCNHHCKRQEHITLGCPSQDLTKLRTQLQHLFTKASSSAPPSSVTRLRGFMNQADVLGLANLVTGTFLLQLSCPLQAGTAL